jgi:hypothetical protein
MTRIICVLRSVAALSAAIMCLSAFSCGGSRGNEPLTVLHLFSQDAFFENGILISAVPRPSQRVAGHLISPLPGSQGNVTSFDGRTSLAGRFLVDNAVLPGHWFAAIFWEPDCLNGETSIEADIQPTNDIIFVCNFIFEPIGFGTNDARFVLSGSTPATMTAGSTQPLTAAGGLPHMEVFDRNGNQVSDLTAIAVSSDGTKATFGFPKQSSGAALVPDMYSAAIVNQTSPAVFHNAGPNYFVIGATSSYPGAFGVDAADVTSTTTITCPGTGLAVASPTTVAVPILPPPCKPQSFRTTMSKPLVTEYYANQVSYFGRLMPVGTRPVAIKAYGHASVVDSNDGDTIQSHTGPARAIVVNSGSNNITVLDLTKYLIAVNIPVGIQPMAVTLNSGATMAYVASAGSGTVSEIDLTSLSVTRTAAVGAGAQSIATDPSGSAVWVGGSGYLKKVSLSTFTVVATQTINGSVNSLAASSGQNSLAYTVVANCCGTSSSFVANEMSLGGSFAPTAYTLSSAMSYATFTMNGTLPAGPVVPGATQVSAQFGNGLAASATPTGFVIYDLVSHNEFLRVNTSTPVRGIASDPNNWEAYFTLPDSNQIITVPLPHN